MSEPPPATPSEKPPPLAATSSPTAPAAESALGVRSGAIPLEANPLSRLSTQMIVGLAVVAVLVLGGVGVLIGQALSSGNKPKSVLISLSTTTTLAPGPTPTSTTPPTTTPPQGGVTLAGGAVTVPVLSGWTTKQSTNGTVVSLSSNCCFVFVQIEHGTNINPTGTVANELQNWVSGQNGYSQVSSDPSQPVSGAQGLGSLTGSAEIPYQALWTGSGGSESYFGVLFAFVRSDGAVLEMQEEAAGSNSAAAHTNYQNATDLQTILNQTVHSFAGQ